MSEIEKGKLKAKRKIKALDFSGANAAVALVSKEQGGPANGMETICIKASNFSDEFIEKMQSVRVELEIPDFIEAFFKLEEEDAKALAYLMGYREDLQEEAMEPEDDFNKWVMENMQSFEILKSLKESDNHAETLSLLTEDQYLGLLQDQALFEKGYKKLEADKQKQIEEADKARKKPRVVSSKKSPAVEKSTEVEPQIASGESKGVNPVVKSENKEKLMTQETKVVEQVVELEMVEKSAFEAIQKQAAETQELLKSAMQELEVFKAEKAALIAKARKQAVVDAIKQEDKAEQLYKSIQGLADDQFDAVVGIVKSLVAKVDSSEMFKEAGATAESAQPDTQESAVARILKSQFNK